MQQPQPPEIDSNLPGAKILAQSPQQGHSNGNSTSNGKLSSSDSADEDQISIRFADWGFKIDRLFEVAYRFYKRNESKAFHPSFDERNKMNALVMQARHGNHDSGKAPDIGVLDFVGQRRQYEWSLLNGMSKSEAMSKFICALDHLCPLFKAHAEAVKISSGILDGDIITKSSLAEETSKNKSPKFELDPQMHNIYTSLCKQTYNQFKGYAEKQYPNDLIKQKYLITSLQEQYYQQYISQMHPELKDSLPNSSRESNQSNSNIPSSLPSPAISDRSNSNNESTINNQSGDMSITPENQLSLVPTAPHLELPLPPKEIYKPVRDTEESTITRPVPKNIHESIYPSDTYNGEDNVQTDISSEELNSDQAANEIASANADTVDRSTEAKLVDRMESITIELQRPHEIKLRNENIKESVRSFRHSDLPPIGVFESFPEPRPIKNTSQKSTPIDQINPNLPRTFSEALEKREYLQETKSDFKAIPTNLEESPKSQEVTSPSVVLAAQTHVDQPIPTKQLDINYHNDSLKTATDELTDASHQSAVQADTCEITVDEQTANIADSSALNIDESQTGTSHEQGPELWDYASDEGHSPILPAIAPYQEPEPATIWSKREISEFKESLDNDKQGGIYEVKESTVVIFEVPTYPDGKYIFWEFATDDFDIGFGLDFVYQQQLSHPLALNIYEDADEDDMEDMMEEDWSDSTATDGTRHDPESGRVMKQNSASDMLEVRQKILAEKRRRQGNTISIVPTYRRDSHQEVFVGRHKYPGRGYYLLRFDNTYSVLRSKTLYFRICYFM